MLILKIQLWQATILVDTLYKYGKDNRQYAAKTIADRFDDVLIAYYAKICDLARHKSSLVADQQFVDIKLKYHPYEKNLLTKIVKQIIISLENQLFSSNSLLDETFEIYSWSYLLETLNMHEL